MSRTILRSIRRVPVCAVGMVATLSFVLSTASAQTVLPQATVGVSYDSGIIFRSFGCSPSGNIPPGLQCYSVVEIGSGVRGTPTQAGTFVFCVYAPGCGAGFSLTIVPSQTASLTANPPAVSFNVTANGGVQVQPIQIGSTGPPITFTAQPSILAAAGNNWLSVIPTGGVTPATINAQVDPSGLSPGVYFGNIVITNVGSPGLAAHASPPAAGQTLTIPVTLNVTAQNLVFYYLLNGPPPATKSLTVIAVGGSAQVNAVAQVNQPAGGSWLAVTPNSAPAPVNLMVSVNPGGLAAGVYTGMITALVSNASGGAQTVGISLVVFGTASNVLTFNYQAGGSAPPPQTSPITSGTPTQINFLSDISTEGGSWLALNPASGTTPSTLTFSVNPSGLQPGSYRALCIVYDAKNDPTLASNYVAYFVTLTVSGGGSTSQVFSHVADGGGWKTSIVLANLDTVPAQFTVNFWADDGSAFSIPLTGSGTPSSVSDTIPVGGSRTIESTGLAATLVEGWAEIHSSQNISGTAIFRLQTAGQEAAVPLLPGGGSKLLIPFDTSASLSLGVALANPSTTQSGPGNMILRNQSGAQITTQAVSVSRHGHTAFVLSNPSQQPADQRGVAEIDFASGMFALGIRGNTGNTFTSIESLLPQNQGNKVISHIADGGGWKTTIVLVNADTVPATFSLSFFTEPGGPFSVPIAGGGNPSVITDTIPVGGSRTIETAGTAATLTQGWAQLTSNQGIGGTAIFREQNLQQEAAVQLLANGGQHLMIPFDNNPGLALGIALANPNRQSSATVTITQRNQDGQVLGSDQVTIPANGHYAGNPPVKSTKAQDLRGVLEIDSPGGPIFALGIRANGKAFTSIRALGN